MFKKRKTILTLALVLTLSLAFTAGAQAEVKNVIVMVGDGLGMGQIDMARYFDQGKDGKLELMKLPNNGIMMTSSVDGVTDSAAAGSAMATGYKTKNGMVAMTPEGKEVDSVLDYAKDQGKATGIISSNKVHDATPATFAASAKDRGEDAKLTRDIIENEVDVVLGGGGDDFSEELMNKAKEKGYDHVTTEKELANTDSEKILGLFNESYMNYILDRDDLNSQEPTVYEMTKKAINVLSKDEDGFFLMSEGARIDHAAYAADVPGVVAETLDFDKAVKYAVDWAKENGDTLVVVVADHETMGFSVTEPIDKKGLKSIEVSPEYMASKMIKNDNGKGFLIGSIQDVFKEYAGVELTKEEAKAFNQSALQDDGSLKYGYLIGWEIGSVIAKKHNVGVLSSDIRAKSSTGGHTLNSVPIFAYGEESEEFNDVIQNTEFAEILFKALGK